MSREGPPTATVGRPPGRLLLALLLLGQALPVGAAPPPTTAPTPPAAALRRVLATCRNPSAQQSLAGAGESAIRRIA
ncbi:MAG: hypothetical protein RBU45_26405, partial [Myxococcota bacterium]|nr:hypothetical protein [Myxococcota bacterium]